MKPHEQKAINEYLAEFARVNGDRTPPSDFTYRSGWLTFRHFGVTHRQRWSWLLMATDRLRQQNSYTPKPAS